MIKKLRKLLHKHIIINSNDINDGDKEISNLLKGIEDMGMLPPDYEKITKGYDILTDEPVSWYTTITRQWTPEND